MADLSSQKKKTWKAFSQYIRTRDCIATTGGHSFGKCVTCGKLKAFGELQAGHAIGGRTNSVLFDADIVRAQCYGCNCCHGGEQAKFAAVLIEEHGLEWFEDKLNQRHKTVKFTVGMLKEMETEFKQKTEELING